MDTISTCPLGHTCLDARDGKLHRCSWLIDIDFENASTQQKEQRRNCAIAWLPTLMIDQTSRILGVQQAAESTRNEVARTNDIRREVLTKMFSNQRTIQILEDRSLD